MKTSLHLQHYLLWLTFLWGEKLCICWPVTYISQWQGMSIKNRNKVHVYVTIYCHNLSIQMALLYSKAESKSYAVVPMMLFSLKPFRAPVLGILFKFLLPSWSKLPFLCTSEKGSKWYFKSQILIGNLFWERWLAPMVDALWALEMWWAPWQLPERHMVASLSHLPGHVIVG